MGRVLPALTVSVRYVDSPLAVPLPPFAFRKHRVRTFGWVFELPVPVPVRKVFTLNGKQHGTVKTLVCRRLMLRLQVRPSLIFENLDGLCQWRHAMRTCGHIVKMMKSTYKSELLYVQPEEEDRDLANPRLQNRGPISMSKPRSLHTNYIQNCQFT